MPACITSLFLELMPSPKLGFFSISSTDFFFCAQALAIAIPITPAPTIIISKL